MLDNDEMARRVRHALDGAKRGVQAAVASACGITPQAVTGWRSTGLVDKGYLVALARLTNRRVDYFLDESVTDEQSASPSQLLDLDADILASAIVALKESAKRSEVELDFFDAAAALAYAYGQRVKHPKKMTKAEYAVFDKEIMEKLSEGMGNEKNRGRTAIGSTEGVSKPSAKAKKAGARG